MLQMSSKRVSISRVWVQTATVCFALAVLAACVYRPPIQQGNFLDPASVKQLQVGMTRSQVRFLLGTPMLPDAFDNDRWDYVYYLSPSRKAPTEQWRLTVWFEDEKVSRYENLGVPEPNSPEAVSAAASAAGVKGKMPGAVKECKRRWYWPIGCKSPAAPKT